MRKSKTEIKNRITQVISTVTAIAMVSSTLCGCDLQEEREELRDRLTEYIGDHSEDVPEVPDVDPGYSGSNIVVYDTDGTEVETSVIDMMEQEDNSEVSLSGVDLVSSNARLFNGDYPEYAYSKLDSGCQEIYKEIYAVLCSHEKDVELSTLDDKVIDQAFSAVMADHPEIFYVTGYSMSKYMLGKELKKIAFTGTYTMDKKTADAKMEDVENYTARCLSGISQNADDYEKVKYVYEYLIKNTEYDLTAVDNQNILSVCEAGVTVCQGYTKMAQYLLYRLGVFCTIVNGLAMNAAVVDDDGVLYIPEEESSDDGAWGTHVWNIVQVNGKYYNMDVTWGDSAFMLNTEDGECVDSPDINYDYLLVPDAIIRANHEPRPVVEMPACNDMQDNYYVHEGLYFTDVDANRIKAAFDKAYANGDTGVTLKCADMPTYEKMSDHLFSDEKVFDYLAGTSVKYVQYPDRYVITIYL